MAKTNLRTLPFGTYAAGTYQLASINIGQNSSSFEVALDRTALPATPVDVASLTLEGSDDNGATWNQLVAGTLAGGAVVSPSGAVATESTFGASFDNSTKPSQYRLRGSITLFQTLTTGARLTVF